MSETQIELPPVKVSGNALRDLSTLMRTWSGWTDARLTFGEPDASISPYAHTDFASREFVVSVDRLLLNPHRVLRTVNPFRLRQEGILTGALLHEAGHARHTGAWCKPGATHADGSAPVKATVALALTTEEARIEGLMYRDANKIGARGLGWTMRAMAAALLPMTEVSDDPDQAIMDIITSWLLRAGRQIAIEHWSSGTVSYHMPSWVGDFTTLVTQAIAEHLTAQAKDGEDITFPTQVVLNKLRNMIRHDIAAVSKNAGESFLLDEARDVLAILFPNTPPEDMPSAGGGCGSAGEGGETREGTPGAAAEAQSDEQGSEGEEDQTEGEGASEGEGDTEVEDSKPATGVAKALADLEKEAEDQTKNSTKAEANSAPPREDTISRSISGGKGDGSVFDGTWREPTKDERTVAVNASRFLRDLINPAESSKTTLTDTPSSTVDGAALAAWKAGGQRRDPRFFVRTRREVIDSPPVKIAVLVDVSDSMSALQGPSALLSWALSTAVTDLANFAGRGTKVESTLIHWGNAARVIQRNGETLPGLRTVACNEGTRAMAEALALVEEQVPGFFDVSEKPENRLLVQFTDWELFGAGDVVAPMQRLMTAGVNMLTVMPEKRSFGDLSSIMSKCPVQRGRNVVIEYNSLFPEQIWDEATRLLR